MANAQAVQAEPKTVTVVINNREALVIGQMPHLTDKSKDGTPQLGDPIVFQPGLNLVPSKVLAKLRENTTFEQNFTTKIPRSPAPEQNPEKVGMCILVVGKELPVERPLAKLDPREALELVEETLSLAMLQKFEHDEGRPDVRAEIANRIQHLKSGGVAA